MVSPKKRSHKISPKHICGLVVSPKNCSPQNLLKTYLWFGGFPKQIPKLILYIIYTTMRGWPQKFLKGTPNMPNLIFGPRTDPCIYIYIDISTIQNPKSLFKIQNRSVYQILNTFQRKPNTKDQQWKHLVYTSRG